MSNYYLIFKGNFSFKYLQKVVSAVYMRCYKAVIYQKEVHSLVLLWYAVNFILYDGPVCKMSV